MAKRRLFAELLPPGATAVLNADVPEFADLAGLAVDRGLQILDYGRRAGSLRLVDRAATADGQWLEVELLGRRHGFASRLVGAFQAHNLLAAAGLVLGTGGDIDAVLQLLTALRAPPGRMQLTALHPSGAAAFVDYAHSPRRWPRRWRACARTRPAGWWWSSAAVAIGMPASGR